MLSFLFLYTHEVYWKMYVSIILFKLNGYMLCHLDTYLLADVNAKWKMLFQNWMGCVFSGRCY